MFKALNKWLPGYFESVLSRTWPTSQPRHLLFCLADHFEPSRSSDADPVSSWLKEYPAFIDGITDADGKPPRHTFFFPQEEYNEPTVGKLAEFCGKGWGEVEVHLHHRNDTKEGLKEKLADFRDILSQRHGLLGRSDDGNPRYGFIHGNWALCNSRPDGDWCGVNEELGVLKETGCYADFTFPSAPSSTQPRMVNAIYRAEDIPGKPRSCDKGRIVRVKELNHGTPHPNPLPEGEGIDTAGDPLPGERREVRGQKAKETTNHSNQSSLMLITGPLALNWKRRKWGILPRIENGAISSGNLPSEDRIDLWTKQQVQVAGRPEWVFIKVYTHGCAPGSMDVLLGDGMRKAHEYLHARYNDGQNWKLHYVTAREMYNVIRAAEDGRTGDPGQYRNYEITSPDVNNMAK